MMISCTVCKDWCCVFWSSCDADALRVLVVGDCTSHLQDGVGLVAINDSLWLESVIYEILKKFIRREPYYLQVVELFQEVSCSLYT